MVQKGVKIVLSIFMILFIITGIFFGAVLNDDIYNRVLYAADKIKIFAGIKVYDSQSVIVKYNGTTIDEAVKGNSVIEEKAKYITERCTSDREKAHSIYSWIGSNIEYDTDKADRVLSEDEEISDSGAIYAFRDRSGVCFDYACLYVAMAQSTDLKVRLVIGKAFDGNDYVAHAWNEVYIQDEQKWVNVDCTFFAGGNYFDTDKFDRYQKEEIAGEW